MLRTSPCILWTLTKLTQVCSRRYFIKRHLCAQAHHCHRKYESDRWPSLPLTATVDVSPCEQHRHITNTTQTLDTLKDQSCVILSSKYAKNQAKLMLYNGLNHKKKVYLIKLSISISKRSSSSKLYFFYLKNPFCLVKSDLSQWFSKTPNHNQLETYMLLSKFKIFFFPFSCKNSGIKVSNYLFK